MVDNDVNLMAMGEQHAGVARSVGDFLCVRIGTGIGCGIVAGGEATETRAPAATGAVWKPTSAAEQGRSEELASRLAANGTLTALDLIREGGDRTGRSSPAWSPSSTRAWR